jgi:tRNA (cmo5U34)-methyltransferase
MKNDFDLVSPIYDGLATLTFGGAIHRAQVSLLSHVSDIDSALVIGGGTGWFLLELLTRTSVRRVTYIDLSQEMLRKSVALIERSRPDFLERVEFRLGSEESLTDSDGPYDLIVTNFFLDLFEDENCARIAGILHRRLAPAGRWLFVDFHVPDAGWQRLSALALFKAMFTFFNVFSKMESRRPPNYEAAFARIGMRPYLVETFFATMIRAKLLRRG